MLPTFPLFGFLKKRLGKNLSLLIQPYITACLVQLSSSSLAMIEGADQMERLSSQQEGQRALLLFQELESP